MDNISLLLQEAKPLWQKRQNTKRCILTSCLTFSFVMLMILPIGFNISNNHNNVESVYTALYSNKNDSNQSVKYFIDEFDVMGII